MKESNYELLLNISNKQKLFELLNNGIKPDTNILNSYLDTCNKYNKEKCDIEITKKRTDNEQTYARVNVQQDVSTYVCLLDNARKRHNMVVFLIEL